MKKHTDNSYIKNGFKEIDNILDGGLHKSHFVIIAGRPSMGKSTFCNNIVMTVSRKVKLPVALFSLEMTCEMIVQKLIATQKNTDFQIIDIDKYQKMFTMNDIKICIDDRSELTVNEIEQTSKKILVERGLAMIVIDYIQLMTGSTPPYNNKEHEMSEIAKSLDTIAKEFHIPVLAISQLRKNIEDRQDKRPMLFDLTPIEQESDVVMFVYRESMYTSYAKNEKDSATEIIISKNRNGTVGKSILRGLSY